MILLICKANKTSLQMNGLWLGLLINRKHARASWVLRAERKNTQWGERRKKEVSKNIVSSLVKPISCSWFLSFCSIIWGWDFLFIFCGRTLINKKYFASCGVDLSETVALFLDKSFQCFFLFVNFLQFLFDSYCCKKYNKISIVMLVKQST